MAKRLIVCKSGTRCGCIQVSWWFYLAWKETNVLGRLMANEAVCSTLGEGTASLVVMSVHRTPLSLQLPEYGEVHVWGARVSEVQLSVSVLSQLLSKQELETAARFVRSADRERYWVAHGVLRTLLSNYINIPPAGIEFATGAFGKPDLACAGVSSPLRFNLAHSGDVVLYAFSLQRQVGIDIEQIRAEIDGMEIARSHFAPEEIEALCGMDEGERIGSFFRCWTRKEAYVKARGEGLSLPLDKFTVPVGGTECILIPWAEGNSAPPKVWTLFNLDVCPGYAAAVVIEGRAVRLNYRPWDNRLLPGGDR